MLCFEVYRPIELSLEKKPAFFDNIKQGQVEVVNDVKLDFDPKQRREASRSTVIKSSTETSFYPFESMESDKLKNAIMTSNDMN